MVHLSQVPNRRESMAPVVEGLEKAEFFPPGEDDFTTSVYGSHFAAEDLPVCPGLLPLKMSPLTSFAEG